MKRPHLSILALLTVACAPQESAPYGGEMFWIELTDAGTACPDTEITTNIGNSQPADAGALFTGSREESLSAGGDYAYITRSNDGAIFVNFMGEVLVGQEKDNGSIEVGWTSSEQVDETLDAKTYEHTRVEQQTIERTLTMGANVTEEDPNPVYLGSLMRHDYLLIELTETDEWDPAVVGTGTSQMPETGTYLEWIEPPGGFGNQNVVNQEYADDCPEDVCELRVFQDCTRQFDVIAYRLDTSDIDVFSALEGYDQPEGVP